MLAVLPADDQIVMRLLAYHGARSKEICQLRCTDVTTLMGVPVIRIHDRTGGTVKNRHARLSLSALTIRSSSMCPMGATNERASHPRVRLLHKAGSAHREAPQGRDLRRECQRLLSP